MAQLTIFWTKTAIRQRNHVFSYWNNRNKSNEYSKKLNLRIKERTHLLKLNSKLGLATEFKKTRAISLGHYSILYNVYQDKIIITGFWDNRQNPKKLFHFLQSD